MAHSWKFMTHWWSFMTKKSHSWQDNFCLIHVSLWKFMTIPSAKRKYILFMTIYDFIDDHFWLKKSAERKTNISLISFLTKNPRSAKPKTIYIIFDKEKTIQVKNSWVILNPGQKGFRGSRSQCPTINALGYRLCKSPNNKFRALFCSKVRVSWGDLPSAASPPTYATPIECALWYLQCAPTIASGLPLSIVPSVGIT